MKLLINLLSVLVGLIVLSILGYIIYLLGPSILSITYQINKALQTPIGIWSMVTFVILGLLVCIIYWAYCIGKKIIEWFQNTHN